MKKQQQDTLIKVAAFPLVEESMDFSGADGDRLSDRRLGWEISPFGIHIIV